MSQFEKQLKSLHKPRLNKQVDLKIQKSLKWYIFKEELAYSFTGFRLFKKSLAFALVVLLLSSSASVYAYTSESVIPGHGLYKLRLELENLELKLVNQPDKLALKYVKFTDRRISEAVTLSEDSVILNEDNIAKTLSEARNLKDLTRTEIKNIENEDKSKVVAATVQTKLSEQTPKLEKIAKNVGLVASDEVIDNLLDLFEEPQPETVPQEELNTENKEQDQEKLDDSNTEESRDDDSEHTSKKLESIKTYTNNYRERFKDSEGANDDMKKLVEQIDKRVEKAEDGYRQETEEEHKQADAYIKSAEGLINYGKYFVDEEAVHPKEIEVKGVENKTDATTSETIRVSEEKDDEFERKYIETESEEKTFEVKQASSTESYYSDHEERENEEELESEDRRGEEGDRAEFERRESEREDGNDD